MALTSFQRDILWLLARERIAAGERYVAGGVALGELLASLRISRDIDLFHDAAEAVATSWEANRARLVAAGCEVDHSVSAPPTSRRVLRATAGRRVWSGRGTARFASFL